MVALIGALVALLGTRLTYKAAMRSLKNQQVLADREAAGKVLDDRSVELAEIDIGLADLADCLSNKSEKAIRKAREGHLPPLRAAARKMEREHERLRIRFRSDVADSFGLAPTAVLDFLESKSVEKLRGVPLGGGMAFESAESRTARETAFQEFMAGPFSQVDQALSKTRDEVASARSDFRDAAYEMIGIGKG